MSHHAHPIFALSAVVLAAFAIYAHGQAKNNYSYLTEQTSLQDASEGFVDLGMAKHYTALAYGKHQDEEARWRLYNDAKAAQMAHVFRVGDVVAIERQQPEEKPDRPIWVCMRPKGDPTCYWAADVVALNTVWRVNYKASH